VKIRKRATAADGLKPAENGGNAARDFFTLSEKQSSSANRSA
jgi:hypothetical protein